MVQQQSGVPAGARILRRIEVQARTGLSRSSIYRGIQEGRFPKALNIGPRMVGWVEAEIQAWIDDRVQERERVPVSAASNPGFE